MLRSPARLRLSLAIGLAASLLTSILPAGAETAGDCTGNNEPRDAGLAVARVAGSERTFFVKGTAETPGCPSARPACRARGFVVPGDRVLVGRSRAGFTRADYIGAKGGDRAGWLPSERLIREDPAPVLPKDWLGTWLREEAEVTLTPARAGQLSIRGEATYGGLDPNRVKRGAVNLGDIEGETAPAGPALAFAMGDGKTLPVDVGDATACKVWMRRLGPYLLVDDNQMCGGNNVTFCGIYRRKP